MTKFDFFETSRIPFLQFLVILCNQVFSVSAVELIVSKTIYLLCDLQKYILSFLLINFTLFSGIAIYLDTF